MTDCMVCGKSDDKKPMCFRGEKWCCDAHRKLLVINGDIADFVSVNPLTPARTSVSEQEQAFSDTIRGAIPWESEPAYPDFDEMNNVLMKAQQELRVGTNLQIPQQDEVPGGWQDADPKTGRHRRNNHVIKIVGAQWACEKCRVTAVSVQTYDVTPCKPAKPKR
jgi:hypothetical protein